MYQISDLFVSKVFLRLIFRLLKKCSHTLLGPGAGIMVIWKSFLSFRLIYFATQDVSNEEAQIETRRLMRL